MNLLSDLPSLLIEHGYSILVLGLLIEGETCVVLASFAAHEGWLRLPAVLAIAAGIAWLNDQLFFWLGRRHGSAVLARWPRVARAVGPASRLVARYPHASVLGVRFAYGMRTAGPVLLGASGLSPVFFAALSAVAALLWAGIFGSLGWFFGAAAERVLAQASQVQMALIGLVLALAAVVWWLRRRRG